MRHLLDSKQNINILYTLFNTLMTGVTLPSRYTSCCTYTIVWGTRLVFTLPACFLTVESIFPHRTC